MKLAPRTVRNVVFGVEEVGRNSVFPTSATTVSLVYLVLVWM